MNRKIFVILLLFPSIANAKGDGAAVIGFATGLVGALVMALVYFVKTSYRKIKNSGITTKEGRARNKKIKQIELIKNNIGELKNLLNQGIINKSQFTEKKSKLHEDIQRIKLEIELERNGVYKSIIDAHEKGLISNEQKLKKISELEKSINIASL